MNPSMTAPTAAIKSGTQVVQRVAALLRSVSARNRLGARLIDLCTEVNIERPTAHRILQGLVSEGLIRQDETSKRYFLGSMIYEMGLAASPRTNMRDLCHAHLQQIAQTTGDTVFLTTRAGFDGVCIDRAEGAFPIKVFVLEVGRRRPLNIGGGALAILSFLDDNEIERILSINKERCAERYPNYSEAEVRKIIARARARGFVISDVVELPGVRTIAFPIFDKNNNPVAAISVATLSQRMDKGRSDLAISCITKAIEQIQPTLLTMEDGN
jgi:DNA-binding IclR family transcriptional regulator